MGNKLFSFEPQTHYKNVVSNPDRPLVIETTTARVEVLGTAFNLRAIPEEGSATPLGPPRGPELLISRFGELFARTLTPLEPGDDWQGPLPSGFGWHLVRLRDRELGEADFDSLRERVLNDWRNAEIAARQQRAFATLREAYRIEIER